MCNPVSSRSLHTVHISADRDLWGAENSEVQTPALQLVLLAAVASRAYLTRRTSHPIARPPIL